MRKILILFLIITNLLISCGKITHKKFNSERWKTENIDSEENWNLRWSMMNDLRNNNKLEGQTKKEIIELLGKPETETQNEFYYYLGYSGKGINTGTLIITFNKNNKVIKVNVTEG
ncbi:MULTISPECIES: hypothetical protein [unclassified Empedobacter]|uniref:hypothetical protein n=1 Tax=unclassified Empedobacter TaxID=2643773 RepID=UPI0025C26756|nr:MULTISPECIES: hypothetical protein [unclassified Empedobacter]